MKKDDIWLFKEILHFLEHDLKDKKRFHDMEGKDFAHALMLVYGAYILNQNKTGNLTILPIK